MYPSDNNTPQTSASYLDQIAVQPTKNSNSLISKLFKILIIATGVVVIAVIATTILTSLVNPDEQLAARLLATQNLSGSAASKITSASLNALNKSLSDELSVIITESKSIFTDEKIDTSNLNKKILADESIDSVLSSLDAAEEKAVFDRTYAREMAYQLDKLINLFNQVKARTTNSKLNKLLTNHLDNLKTKQAGFADFNESVSD